MDHAASLQVCLLATMVNFKGIFNLHAQSMFAQGAPGGDEGQDQLQEAELAETKAKAELAAVALERAAIGRSEGYPPALPWSWY